MKLIYAVFLVLVISTIVIAKKDDNKGKGHGDKGDKGDHGDKGKGHGDKGKGHGKKDRTV